MDEQNVVKDGFQGMHHSTGAPIGKDTVRPERDAKLTRMGTQSIPRLILEFAIPAIIGMVVNGAYNVIDSVFLGQAVGSMGQAAMTAANPIMIIFIAIAMLFGNGGNALAALRLGEGDRVGAEISLGNTVTVSLIASVIIALVAFFPATIDALLLLSSTTPEVYDDARIFIQIISAGFFLQCIGLGVNNFIRTAGAPNRALVTMIIGAGACIVFNYLFVIQLGWGIIGSAFATVLGQAASCVSVLWYFLFTRNVPFRLHKRYMVLEARTVGRIIALGFASFALQAAAAIINFVLNHLIVQYGSIHPIGENAALASIGVVQRCALFTVFPLVGISIAVQPLLGFNYGARLFARVRQTLRDGIIGATIVAVLMWALVHIFPEQIVGAFGITDPELRDFTITALKVQLIMIPFVGFQIVGANYFQATGQPLKSIFLSLTRQLLFLLPLLNWLPNMLPVWFPQYTSLDALYFAMPVSDFLSIFTTLLFILWELRRIKRLERGEIQATSFKENGKTATNAA